MIAHHKLGPQAVSVQATVQHHHPQPGAPMMQANPMAQAQQQANYVAANNHNMNKSNYINGNNNNHQHNQHHHHHNQQEQQYMPTGQHYGEPQGFMGAQPPPLRPNYGPVEQAGRQVAMRGLPPPPPPPQSLQPPVYGAGGNPPGPLQQDERAPMAQRQQQQPYVKMQQMSSQRQAANVMPRSSGYQPAQQVVPQSQPPPPPPQQQQQHQQHHYANGAYVDQHQSVMLGSPPASYQMGASGALEGPQAMQEQQSGGYGQSTLLQQQLNRQRTGPMQQRVAPKATRATPPARNYALEQPMQQPHSYQARPPPPPPPSQQHKRLRQAPVQAQPQQLHQQPMVIGQEEAHQLQHHQQANAHLLVGNPTPPLTPNGPSMAGHGHPAPPPPVAPPQHQLRPQQVAVDQQDW